MQNITIASPSSDLSKAAEVLTEYAVPKYFDSISYEYFPDEVPVYSNLDCKIGNSTLRFRMSNTSNSSRLIFADNNDGISIEESFAYNSVFYISRILVCDKAIVIYLGESSSSTLYAMPIVICKTTSGKTAVLHGGQTSVGTMSATSNIAIRTFTLGTNINAEHYYNVYTLYNNFSVMIMFNAARSDSVLDGIYVSSATPFGNVQTPLMFELNGKSYCSIAYGCIAIETT